MARGDGPFQRIAGSRSALRDTPARAGDRGRNRDLTMMTDAILGIVERSWPSSATASWRVRGADPHGRLRRDRAFAAARERPARPSRTSTRMRTGGHGEGFLVGVGLTAARSWRGTSAGAAARGHGGGDTAQHGSRIEGMTKGTHDMVLLSDSVLAAFKGEHRPLARWTRRRSVAARRRSRRGLGAGQPDGPGDVAGLDQGNVRWRPKSRTATAPRVPRRACRRSCPRRASALRARRRTSSAPRAEAALRAAPEAPVGLADALALGRSRSRRAAPGAPAGDEAVAAALRTLNTPSRKTPRWTRPARRRCSVAISIRPRAGCPVWSRGAASMESSRTNRWPPGSRILTVPGQRLRHVALAEVGERLLRQSRGGAGLAGAATTIACVACAPASRSQHGAAGEDVAVEVPRRRSPRGSRCRCPE